MIVKTMERRTKTFLLGWFHLSADSTASLSPWSCVSTRVLSNKLGDLFYVCDGVLNKDPFCDLQQSLWIRVSSSKFSCLKRRSFISERKMACQGYWDGQAGCEVSTLHVPVHLRFHIQVGSPAVSSDQKNQAADRSGVCARPQRGRGAPRLNEPAQVVQEPDVDPPGRLPVETTNWEETQNLLDGLYISSGLRTPRDPEPAVFLYRE